MKFYVYIPELHKQEVEIEAESEEEAIKKVKDGDGEYKELYYCITFEDMEHKWTAKKQPLSILDLRK